MLYALGEALPVVDPDAYVHPQAVLIGAVSVGAGATIWPGAVLRADYGQIEVGSGTSVQDGSVIHVTPHHSTHIGARCVIGHLAHLEGCVVEDDCLVGSGAVVLPGATVRAGALVGAGAVVTIGMEVPARAMALGVPATVRTDAVAIDAFRDSVERYVSNGARYRDQLRRID